MFFYAIDCKNKPVKPVELNPKPRAISATYEVGDDLVLALDNTSPIVEIEHNVWLGQQVQFQSRFRRNLEFFRRIDNILQTPCMNS